MDYENLLKEADSFQIIVKEKQLKQFDGLIKGRKIAIRQDIPTLVEKSCVLAEELGHFFTTSGNILDQSIANNRKQEKMARVWAYEKQIGLSGIISGYKNKCQNRYELADFLGVTEVFLQDALNFYKEKYGNYIEISEYIIIFEPNLVVIEKI